MDAWAQAEREQARHEAQLLMKGAYSPQRHAHAGAHQLTPPRQGAAEAYAAAYGGLPAAAPARESPGLAVRPFSVPGSTPLEMLATQLEQRGRGPAQAPAPGHFARPATVGANAYGGGGGAPGAWAGGGGDRASAAMLLA